MRFGPGRAAFAAVLNMWEEVLTSPAPDLARHLGAVAAADLAEAAATLLLFALEVGADDATQALEMLDGLRSYIVDFDGVPGDAAAAAEAAFADTFDRVWVVDGRFHLPRDVVRASVIGHRREEVAWAVVRPLHVAGAAIYRDVGEGVAGLDFFRSQFLETGRQAVAGSRFRRVRETNTLLLDMWEAVARRDAAYLEFVAAATDRHLLAQSALRHLAALVASQFRDVDDQLGELAWLGEQLTSSVSGSPEVELNETTRSLLGLGATLADYSTAAGDGVLLPVSQAIGALAGVSDLAAAYACLVPLRLLSAVYHDGDETAAVAGFRRFAR